MPSTTKSPHATSFKSAIKRGTPAGIAVNAIAKRSNKRPGAVFSSLHKAGLCHRQKFNGQWIYWACEAKKCSATAAKSLQSDFWQSFIDWSIAGGHCNPQQLARNISSQQQFMNSCRKFFNRQFSATSSRSPSSKSGRSRNSSYKFPRTGSTTRRLRKAA